MSLRKSPTLTPARLAANRRNARKSTGPRTARGKAQSRMNGLRNGDHSPAFIDLLYALLTAPPGRVNATARAVLTPEQAAHPVFAGMVDIARQAEASIITAEHEREEMTWYPSAGPRRGRPLSSAKLTENKP
jgi:hypothetical protein